MPLPADFEKKLWDAADQLWTNAQLQPSEYSTPVLALIFLEEGVVYLPPEARYQRLLDLPEGADIGKAINDALIAGPLRTRSAQPCA